MQLFLGNLANTLKDAKDKNKEYNKEIKKLNLSIDHARYMQSELLKIKDINNDTYLNDIEAVMAALSESELSEEIELFIQNYFNIKRSFDNKCQNYDPITDGIDGINKTGLDLFTSYFDFILDDVTTDTGEVVEKKYDTSILDNSQGIQELYESSKNEIIMEYTYQTGKIKYYDEIFQTILGKWVLIRYKDLTGKDLYEEEYPNKAADLLTLTSLLISFYTFIQEEQENIIKYIEDYSNDITTINSKIEKVLTNITKVLIVIGSIIKEDLYYNNSESAAKRLIYRSHTYYDRINSILQEIIDRNNLNVELQHVTQSDTYYNTITQTQN